MTPEQTDTLSPAEARAARAITGETRDRMHARLTLAERDVLAAAADPSRDLIAASLKYQSALWTARFADEEYEAAEADDLRLNPPAAQIASAETAAADAAAALTAARAAFNALVAASPALTAAAATIDTAAVALDLAIDHLRDVVKAAAAADPDLRGAQGYTKAATVNRSVKAEIADPISALIALKNYVTDGETLAQAAAAVTFKPDALAAIAPHVLITRTPAFTVSISPAKLTRA